MTNKFSFSTLKWVYIILLLYPIVNMVMLYSYYLRIWSLIGYAPSYNNPDPKDLKLDSYHQLVTASFDILPASAIALTLAGIYYLITKKRFLNIRHRYLAISLGSFILLLFTLLSPVFEWFID